MAPFNLVWRGPTPLVSLPGLEQLNWDLDVLKGVDAVQDGMEGRRCAQAEVTDVGLLLGFCPDFSWFRVIFVELRGGYLNLDFDKNVYYVWMSWWASLLAYIRTVGLFYFVALGAVSSTQPSGELVCS